jgi:hypothetical protein
MRQRTRSRSRARSQTSAFGDEDEIALGLQRLLDKLRQYQPLFTEEDVAAIPFPPDNGGSCSGSPSSSAPVSPRLSPSRLDNEESQTQLVSTEAPSPSPPPPAADKKGRKVPSQLSKVAPTTHAVSSSIDLDCPLSPTLFVTAVNLFDAKMLAKSKRVATDALKLVRQAYAFIWRDPDYLATPLNGEPNRGANGTVAALQRGHEAALAEALASRRGSHGSCRVLFSAAAPSPEHQPKRQLALLLDECIRVLLVYANVSVNFCHSVSSNSRVLLLLSFVCCAARRLEEEDEVLYGEGRGSAADIIVGNRNLHTELDSLGMVWQGCGIEGRVVDALRECYLIEFLLDAALPPAVCSSRYDGLLTAVVEKKRRIIGDVVASRSGFAHMMHVAPLRGLCGLANMSAFGDAKLRARLLDKMASEGVVERLASEISSAMTAILSVDDSSPPSRSPSKRRRSMMSQGASPPFQRSRASTSGLPSRRVSLDVAQPSRLPWVEGQKADEMDISRVSTGLDRILNTQPTPVERIGQCVDILMLLSSPNLCPPEGSEASSSRTSASSAPGAVRATTWASHEEVLHEICLHLLAICFLSKTHARYAELASLQLYAADCVLQWAAYSGKFYTTVVHALDELLDMIEAEGIGIDSSTLSPQSPPLPASRSPSRPPPPTAKNPEKVATVPGQHVLRRLLPGDETGLLPLLTNLLQYTIHAEANAPSIQRWFQFLASRLLPGVFEVPQLTTGRRSTSEWGRQRLQEQHQQQKARKFNGASSSLPPPTTASLSSAAEADVHDISPPVLARDLTRAEVVAVAPYFRFVRQVVEETSWRAGTAALFGKVVLLAFNVIVTQGHRCNLVFGQACACYDVAAPLLLTMQCKTTSSLEGLFSSTGERGSDGSSNISSYRRSTVLMHQLRREEEEGEEQEAGRLSVFYASGENGSLRMSEGRRIDMDKDEEEVFISSAAKKRSPSRRVRRQGSFKEYSSVAQHCSSATVNKEESAELSPFISSPSGSPVFYEPYSPSSGDTGVSPDRSEGSRSPSDRSHRGSDLRAALEEAATPPPLLQSGGSPQPVTTSWTGRLSLRALLSSISGYERSPPLEK